VDERGSASVVPVEYQPLPLPHCALLGLGQAAARGPDGDLGWSGASCWRRFGVKFKTQQSCGCGRGRHATRDTALRPAALSALSALRPVAVAEADARGWALALGSGQQRCNTQYPGAAIYPATSSVFYVASAPSAAGAGSMQQPAGSSTAGGWLVDSRHEGPLLF
jgi:hypothetical protein